MIFLKAAGWKINSPASVCDYVIGLMVNLEKIGRKNN